MTVARLPALLFLVASMTVDAQAPAAVNLPGGQGCNDQSLDGYIINVRSKQAEGTTMQTVTLEWQGPLGHPASDWAALYLANSCPTTHSCYLHCCWQTLGPYENNTITFDASSLASFLDSPFEVRLFKEGTYTPIIRSCQFRLPGYKNFDPAGYKKFKQNLGGHFTPPPRASSAGELGDTFSVTVGQNLVVIGGTDRVVAILDDVWTLEMKMPYNSMTWRKVQVVPDPTYGMPKPGIGSFLGVQGNSIFLFGGYTTLAYPRTATNDMWELQLSTDMTSGTWAPIRTFNTPQARYGMAGTMVKSSIWLFGGRASDGGGDRATEILGGLGELPFVAGQQNSWDWREQYVGLAQPLRLYGHVALYNTRDEQVFVYGGRSMSGLQNRAYSMTLRNTGVTAMPFNRWDELNTTGVHPPPMEGMSLDQYQDTKGVQVLLFGGRDEQGVYSNSLYQLDYTSGEWTKLAVPNTLPAARASHVATIVSVANEAKGLLIYAGRNQQFLQDMWLYDFALREWRQLPSFSPEGRYDHSADEVLGGKMLVFGGVSSRLAVPPSSTPDQAATASQCGCTTSKTSRIMFNDLWQYTLVNKAWQWQLLTPSGTPPMRRAGHASAVYSNKLIIMNGLGEDGTVLGDSWQFGAVMNQWSPLQMNQAVPAPCLPLCVNNAPPPPLYRQFMGVRGRGLIVYGGMSSLGAVGGLWSWSFATSEWRIVQATSSPGPGARYGHSGAMYGDDRLIVMGGFRGIAGASSLSDADADGLSDVWAYSFVRNAWEMLKPMAISDNFGASGGFSSSVRVGGQMLLFGTRRRKSQDTAEYTNSYAQYSIDTGEYEWQPGLDPNRDPTQPVFPSPRAGASFISMTTQDVVLFGGVGATAMNDLWKMNLNPVCDIGLSAIPSASSKCFPCVPGTFYNAGKCNTCAQGSYSKKPGMAQCTACPAGFYGVALGASSLSHCVPCLAGSYSSGTGDIQCRACESANQAFCPLAASKSNNLRPTQAEMTAILPGDLRRRRGSSGSPESTYIASPDLLDYSRTGHQTIMMAVLGLMAFSGFAIGLIMYGVYRVKGIVAPFDFYRLKYKTTSYFSLYPKNLTKGFAVSLIGLIWMFLIFAAIAYNMSTNNQREQFGIVPYSLVQAQSGSKMFFEARFYGTRGACQTQLEGNQTTCSSMVKTVASGFKGTDRGVWDCARMQNEFCKVTWKCDNCTFAEPTEADLGAGLYTSHELSSLSVMLTGENQYASSVTAKLVMTSAVPSDDSVMSTMMTSPYNRLYSGGQARVVVETMPVVFNDYRNDTSSEGSLFLRGWRAEPPLIDASTLHEKEGVGLILEMHRDPHVLQWTRSESMHLVMWLAAIGGGWGFVSVLLMIIFYFFRTIDDKAQYKKKANDFWDTEEALQRTRHQMFKEGRLTQKEFDKMDELILAHNPELFSALESYALENPEERGEEGRFDAYWRIARAVIRSALFVDEHDTHHTGEINQSVAVSAVKHDEHADDAIHRQPQQQALEVYDMKSGQNNQYWPPPNQDPQMGFQDHTGMQQANGQFPMAQPPVNSYYPPASSNGQHLRSEHSNGEPEGTEMAKMPHFQ